MRRLARGGGDIAQQFVDLATLRQFGERRLLGGAFAFAQPLTRLRQRLLALQKYSLAVFVRALQFAQFHVDLFEFFF